jgi:hypothetical protein
MKTSKILSKKLFHWSDGYSPIILATLNWALAIIAK